MRYLFAADATAAAAAAVSFNVDVVLRLCLLSIASECIRRRTN